MGFRILLDLDLVRTSPCAITVILIASILNEKIYYLYNYIRVKICSKMLQGYMDVFIILFIFLYK